MHLIHGSVAFKNLDPSERVFQRDKVKWQIPFVMPSSKRLQTWWIKSRRVVQSILTSPRTKSSLTLPVSSRRRTSPPLTRLRSISTLTKRSFPAWWTPSSSTRDSQWRLLHWEGVIPYLAQRCPRRRLTCSMSRLTVKSCRFRHPRNRPWRIQCTQRTRCFKTVAQIFRLALIRSRISSDGGKRVRLRCWSHLSRSRLISIWTPLRHCYLMLKSRHRRLKACGRETSTGVACWIRPMIVMCACPTISLGPSEATVSRLHSLFQKECHVRPDLIQLIVPRNCIRLTRLETCVARPAIPQIPISLADSQVAMNLRLKLLKHNFIELNLPI